MLLFILFYPVIYLFRFISVYIRLKRHAVFKGVQFLHHTINIVYTIMGITGKNHLGCQWTQEEKCGMMEGPCSDDSHCLFDLICEANSCNEDFSNGTRCCTQPLPCNHTHARTDTCCNELHKCNINEGNCYDNNGCYGNLQCGTKNCDWSSEANCCTHPSNEGGK